MASEVLTGLAAADQLLGRLEGHTRDELGVELATVGRDLLAIQRADVAKDTGALQAGLSLALVVQDLRLRVGLLGTKRGRSKLFYGRVVEFGRVAQTVLVTRTARRAAKVALGGKRGSRGERKQQVAAKSYRLRVKALAPRPYIFVAGAQELVSNQLSNFWAGVLERAGASA